MFKRRQTTVTKKPTAKEVKVSIVFTRLGEIDTINERFSCEATLFITWLENTDLFEKENDALEGTYERLEWDTSKMWDPQLYIDNAIGDVKEKDVKYKIEKLYNDVKCEWYYEVHMIKKIQGSFFEKLELYHFPFDIQDLSITLTTHRSTDEVFLIQDFDIPAKMTKSAALDKHIWKLYDHVNIKMHIIQNDLPQAIGFLSDDLEDVCTYSAITMQCRVSRLPGYFVINCLMPTLMITLCVFFTFLMDYSRMQYRFSLLFTTMLTSITFRWAIHGRVLPTISYLTFLDVYCVSSILIVFGCMIWHAIWIVLYKRDPDFADLADWYAMVVCGGIVILVHVVQTVWFIIAFRKRLYLEKLDKKAALIYLKKRLNSKSTSNDSVNQNKVINNLVLDQTRAHLILNNLNATNLESKRTVYSFSKLDEKPIVQVVKKLDDSIKTPSSRRCSYKKESFKQRKEEFINNNSNNNATNNTSIDDNELNSSSFIIKNGTNNFFGINNIEEKSSLNDYQYLPLVHQSSRDS